MACLEGRRGYDQGMAKPLRIEFAGAVYHVTCRGNARQGIVRDDIDREKWVDWLGLTPQIPQLPAPTTSPWGSSVAAKRGFGWPYLANIREGQKRAMRPMKTCHNPLLCQEMRESGGTRREATGRRKQIGPEGFEPPTKGL